MKNGQKWSNWDIGAHMERQHAQVTYPQLQPPFLLYKYHPNVLQPPQLLTMR